jgi:hypothetical protein
VSVLVQWADTERLTARTTSAANPVREDAGEIAGPDSPLPLAYKEAELVRYFCANGWLGTQVPAGAVTIFATCPKLTQQVIALNVRGATRAFVAELFRRGGESLAAVILERLHDREVEYLISESRTLAAGETSPPAVQERLKASLTTDPTPVLLTSTLALELIGSIYRLPATDPEQLELVEGLLTTVVNLYAPER